MRKINKLNPANEYGLGTPYSGRGKLQLLGYILTGTVLIF